MDHYAAAPRAQHGRSDLLPFAADASDRLALVAFLSSLHGVVDAAPHWLAAPTDSLVADGR